MSSRQFLTTQQAADLLGVSVSYLRHARYNGDGPPYVPIGRAVRYATSDLEHWTNKQRVQTSRDYPRITINEVDANA